METTAYFRYQRTFPLQNNVAIRNSLSGRSKILQLSMGHCWCISFTGYGYFGCPEFFKQLVDMLFIYKFQCSLWDIMHLRWMPVWVYSIYFWLNQGKKYLFVIFSLIKMSTFLVGKLVLRPQKSGNLVDWVSSKFQMLNAKTASGWIFVTRDRWSPTWRSEWFTMTFCDLYKVSRPWLCNKYCSKRHIFLLALCYLWCSVTLISYLAQMVTSMPFKYNKFCLCGFIFILAFQMIIILPVVINFHCSHHTCILQWILKCL